MSAKDLGSAVEHQKTASAEMLIVIRVIKAELLRNFDAFGKMDPYAVVEWVYADGTRWEASRTQTDWNAGMTPHWDHTCRAQPYAGPEGGENIEFLVMEKNVMSPSTFCGSARISVQELLGEAAAQASSASCGSGSFEGQVQQLTLRCDGEETGTITVQALLMGTTAHGPAMVKALTHVDPALFEDGVRRLGVSGGTAPFFRLRLRGPRPGQSPEHFIGKDLSHAQDEVDFYEEALTIVKQPNAGGLATLLGFMFEYAGVLNCAEEGPHGRQRDLLVMRNLRDGHNSLRLLDIKIGQKTAQAGWHGKSRAAALRQSVIDGITNSSCEGFRLEGFDGTPPSLASMDPLLDLGGASSGKVSKKAFRVMLQRLPAHEILMHFLDLHQQPPPPAGVPADQHLSPSEFAEIVHHEVVQRLLTLTIACRRSPVPQKWIGSSVALGFDAGQLPLRSTPEAQLRKATTVNIFDWGRSELNTLEKHMRLSDKEQHDRAQFWNYYVGGVDRLAWEAARAYRHRFGNAGSWRQVMFKIVDFDSMTENDYIGEVVVPVVPTERTTVDLKHHNGSQVSGDYGIRGRSTLTYSIRWRELPAGSRLRGVWEVCLYRADNLPRMDKSQLRTTSDPLCEVTAVGEHEMDVFVLRQMSSVKARNLAPEWNETFELPVAAEGTYLEAALAASAPGMSRAGFAGMFPAHQVPNIATLSLSSSRAPSRWSLRSNDSCSPETKGLAEWQSRLSAAAASSCRPAGEVPAHCAEGAAAVETAPEDAPVDDAESAEVQRAAAATPLTHLKLVMPPSEAGLPLVTPVEVSSFEVQPQGCSTSCYGLDWQCSCM